LRASACESRAARTAPATSSLRRISKTCSFRFKDSAALSVIVTLSYGPNLAAMWRQSAIIVAKLLKGIKPSDLPVEQPTKFELVENLRTAKSLDLTIPPSVLLRADEVIEGTSYTALRRDNDFQNHSLPRRRDPDFPLRTLIIFPTNDANQ